MLPRPSSIGKCDCPALIFAALSPWMTQALLYSRNGSFIQGPANGSGLSSQGGKLDSVEPSIMQMRNKLTFTPQQSSVYDYSASVAKAVEWLGDRYLLAKPINMRFLARQVPVSMPFACSELLDRFSTPQ
jgi:hypothetical protein